MGRAFCMASELTLGHDLDGGAEHHCSGTVFYQVANRRLPFMANDPFTRPRMTLLRSVHSPSLLHGLIAHVPNVQWGGRCDG
jgi:hypothetical protein